jgi:hypothetical protein
MTALKTVLIEKIARDNGFEHEISVLPQSVTMGSARHRTRASIRFSVDPFRVDVSSPTGALYWELERHFSRDPSGAFLADSEYECKRAVKTPSLRV